MKTEHVLIGGAVVAAAVWYFWPKEKKVSVEWKEGEVTGLTTSAPRVNDLSPAYRTSEFVGPGLDPVTGVPTYIPDGTKSAGGADAYALSDASPLGAFGAAAALAEYR